MNQPDPFAQINDQDIIAFTQRFVQIASINGQEGHAAAFIADNCAEAGLRVTVRPVLLDRPNVLVVYPGKVDDIGLLFHGHTDTIPFLGMEKPLSAEIKDGNIWGRGSVDQKGGLAAAIQAMIALARSGIRLMKSVAIAAVIDEESEHRGSMALVDDRLKADAAIITEPSDLHMLVANKGTAPIRINFTGVLAHGSNPWVGVNAIEMAAKTILRLNTLDLKSVDIPGVGVMKASFNAGLIEGGTAYNNVADSCSIWLDRRTVPGENQWTALAQIHELLRQIATEDQTFKASAEIARPDWKWDKIRQRGLCPALTSPESPLAKAIAQAHYSVSKQDVTIGYTNGYNDGDFLVNDLGIPTVNYGPGESHRSHTAKEMLRIDHLLTAVKVYLKTALILTSEYGESHGCTAS
jgi:acetylornithine deacetylase/succinyl-diaminopimelate desuccinylase family protein